MPRDTDYSASVHPARPRLPVLPVSLVLMVLPVLNSGCSAPNTLVADPDTRQHSPSGQPRQTEAEVSPGQPASPKPQRNNPDAANLYLLEQAASLIDNGELQQAAAILDRALRINSREPFAYYEYARLRQQQQQPRQALQLLDRARSLSPEQSLLVRIEAMQYEINRNLVQ